VSVSRTVAGFAAGADSLLEVVGLEAGAVGLEVGGWFEVDAVGWG
jgi:hypothetical protein